jgi:hypothetical protein
MIPVDPYTLPTFDFIAGTTQEIACSVLAYDSKRPCDMTGCKARFSLLNHTNRNGAPLEKSMKIEPAENGVSYVFRVQLDSSDTMNIPVGKYIYQITILDQFGNVDNKQGIMYISNNINKKSF